MLVNETALIDETGASLTVVLRLYSQSYRYLDSGFRSSGVPLRLVKGREQMEGALLSLYLQCFVSSLSDSKKRDALLDE
jgi:hypothetical protein